VVADAKDLVGTCSTVFNAIQVDDSGVMFCCLLPMIVLDDDDSDDYYKAPQTIHRVERVIIVPRNVRC
jgi:hypothetical protein